LDLRDRFPRASILVISLLPSSSVSWLLANVPQRHDPVGQLLAVGPAQFDFRIAGPGYFELEVSVLALHGDSAGDRCLVHADTEGINLVDHRLQAELRHLPESSAESASEDEDRDCCRIRHRGAFLCG